VAAGGRGWRWRWRWFISVEGGSYFFLPGARAVRYLASLSPAPVSLSGRR
jgi:hypothetical protein